SICGLPSPFVHHVALSTVRPKSDLWARQCTAVEGGLSSAPGALHPRRAIRGEAPGFRASSLRGGGSGPLRSGIAIVSWPPARPPEGRAWRRDRRTPGQTPDRIAEGARG